MGVGVRFVCLVVLCSLSALSAFAQSAADLSVVKTGPAQARAGGEVSYDVVLTNNGPSDAVAVTFTDQFPDGMTFVSSGQTAGPAFACPSPGNCTLALFPNGASASFTFVFEIPASMYGGSDPFINVASVSSQTPDPNSANNTDDAVTTMPTADLVLTKTGPDSATIGSDVTYTVTVTNEGPDESLSVQVRDPVPDGLTLVSYTNPPAFTCVDPEVANGFTVVCDAESLAPGETVIFTFVFNIPAETVPGTIFSNTASVRSVSEEDLSLQVFDPNEENNVDSVTTATAGPPQGDLAVLKEGPAAAAADSDVTYTITLSSLGPAAAENVSLEDPLPATMTFVSLAQDPGLLNCTTPAVGAGGTVTCTAPSLAVGATVTLTLTAHIPAEAQPANTFANSVSVTATNDSNDENNSSGVNTTIAVADISVLKQGPAGPLPAGSNIQYDITVTNAGPDDAIVTLTDALPSGTTFVSMAPSTDCLTPAAGSSGTVTCTVLVASGQVRAYILVVKAGDTTSVTNTATAISEFTFDPDNTDDSSSVTTLITPQADLAITKNGPAPVTAGTDVSYTISITNNGPSTATNVSLTDTVPVNTTFVSAVQNSGPAFGCGQAGGVITCTAASFAPAASSTFTFTVHVDPAASGQIDNTASVSSSTADPNGGNNSSTVSAAIVTSADLAVVKTGPAVATAGTSVTYTVIATNNGPSTASTVTLTDILPTGSTTFVSAAQNSGPTFNCTEAAGTITCTIAAFAPGAPATFTFVAAVSPGAANVISNVATINSPVTPDPDASNNAASVPTTIGATADLSVSKTGPVAATAGSDVTYTLTVSNGGPSIASNVSLTDTLPVNATFVSLNQTAGPAFTCNPPAAGQVVCTIASLAVADIATFTLTMNVNAGASGTVENSAAVTSNTADPDPSDNSATAIAGIDAGPTDLTITKTAAGTQFAPGAPVTYTITVTNAGPGVAFATTVTDVLPAGTTFVSATPSQGSCSGTTTVVCALGTLAPASSATIALVVTLPATQGQVVNTATVSAVNVDTNGANNASTNALAVVAHIPSLSQYGLMLLAAMLAVAGLLAVRR